MHWVDELQQAVRRFDGGAASFPLAATAALDRDLRYEVPNNDYRKLFLLQRASTQKSTPSNTSVPAPRSAGWVVPPLDSNVVCKPVFVAHSLLSAIWLLRESLGHSVVADSVWNDLVGAARAVAAGKKPSDATTTQEDDEFGTPLHDIPPSAQMPISDLPASDRRVGPRLSQLSRKRARLSDNEGHSGSDCSDVVMRTGRRNRGISLKRSNNVGGAAQEDASEASAEEGAADSTSISGPAVTITTNKNRRAEQRLLKRLDASRAKKRQELGLIKPNDKASAQERAAYGSISIQDEPAVAWILKQKMGSNADFYSGSPTPYYTAVTVLEKARVLGNLSSQYCAAQFLRTWREQGTPFRSGAETRQLVQASQRALEASSNLQEQGGADSAFCFAWNLCRQYETALAAVHIGSRWALALLGKAYTQKIQQIQQQDLLASNDRTRNRYGKGPVRTEAISSLLGLVYKAPTRTDREVFRNRLKQAMRWHTIVEGLGWGSLLLMPPEEISNWWIERVLRIGQLQVFIDVVRRERPNLYIASRALETWLGPEGIAGGPISGKRMLEIEAESPSVVHEVEEIQDSEDEDDLSESLELTTVHVEEAGVTPLTRFRQMTLIELFNPLP